MSDEKVMFVTIPELATVGACAAGILGFVVKLHKENMKSNTDAAIDRADIRMKVDALWQFQLDRAKIAAEQKAFGASHSPFAATAEAKLMVPPLFATQLKAFYKTLDPAIQSNDVDLAVQILTKFRTELMADLCKPYGLSQGECIPIAMDIARQAAV